MISVQAAAEILNRSERQIRRYCESGELIAKKVGERVWVIEEDSIKRMNESEDHNGR